MKKWFYIIVNFLFGYKPPKKVRRLRAELINE
jgi:hypothetical protein